MWPSRHIGDHFFFYIIIGEGGAGGIWRVAPAELDDPPFLIIKFFGFLPLYPKLIEMTPPPSLPKKKEKKNRKWLTQRNQ